MNKFEMRELYEQGYTIEAIASMAGMSASGTRSRLIAANTTMRSRSAHLPKALTPEDEKCKQGHPVAEYGKFKSNGVFFCRRCASDGEQRRRLENGS